jgi:hypothetical protein
MRDDKKPEAHSERRRNFFLWLGFLGPAVAWLIYLETAYLLVHFARNSGSKTPLHIASVIFILASLALGIISWVQWRKAEPRWPSDLDEGIVARTRTLGALGIMMSAEFSLLIGASWIAMFILSAYQS